MSPEKDDKIEEVENKEEVAKTTEEEVEIVKTVEDDDDDDQLPDEPLPESEKDEKKAAETLEEETPEETFSDEVQNGDELSMWEKFLDFEGTTKAGIISSLILLFGFLFAGWITYTWWLVLILAIVSVRNLYKQKIDLEDEKPFESRISGMFLYGVVALLIVRDIWITMRIEKIMDIADIRHITEILKLF